MGSPKGLQRCLVADDEPQIGALLREILVRHGYAADLVADGQEAAERLSREEYALVVSDILMPRRTGVELVQGLRSRGVAVPVVLMSSHISDDAVAACAELKRVAFLQKPFSLRDVERAIERAVAPVRC